MSADGRPVTDGGLAMPFPDIRPRLENLSRIGRGHARHLVGDKVRSRQHDPLLPTGRFLVQGRHPHVRRGQLRG